MSLLGAEVLLTYARCVLSRIKLFIHNTSQIMSNPWSQFYRLGVLETVYSGTWSRCPDLD